MHDRCTANTRGRKTDSSFSKRLREGVFQGRIHNGKPWVRCWIMSRNSVWFLKVWPLDHLHRNHLQSSWRVCSGSNPELLVKAVWGRSLANCRTTAPRPKAAKEVLVETPTSSSLVTHGSPLDCQGTLSNFPLMITRRGSKNKIASLYPNIENCVARSLPLCPGALICYPCSLCGAWITGSSVTRPSEQGHRGPRPARYGLPSCWVLGRSRGWWGGWVRSWGGPLEVARHPLFTNRYGSISLF